MYEPLNVRNIFKPFSNRSLSTYHNTVQSNRYEFKRKGELKIISDDDIINKIENNDNIYELICNYAFSNLEENDLNLNKDSTMSYLLRNFQDSMEYLINEYESVKDKYNIINSKYEESLSNKHEKEKLLMKNKKNIERYKKNIKKKKNILKVYKSMLEEFLPLKNYTYDNSYYYCKLCDNKKFNSLSAIDQHNVKHHFSFKKNYNTTTLSIKRVIFEQPIKIQEILFKRLTPTLVKKQKIFETEKHKLDKIKEECSGIIDEMKKYNSVNLNQKAKEIITQEANNVILIMKNLTIEQDEKVKGLINEIDVFKKSVASNLKELIEFNQDNTPILNQLQRKRNNDLQTRIYKTKINDIEVDSVVKKTDIKSDDLTSKDKKASVMSISSTKNIPIVRKEQIIQTKSAPNTNEYIKPNDLIQSKTTVKVSKPVLTETILPASSNNSSISEDTNPKGSTMKISVSQKKMTTNKIINDEKTDNNLNVTFSNDVDNKPEDDVFSNIPIKIKEIDKDKKILSDLFDSCIKRDHKFINSENLEEYNTILEKKPYFRKKNLEDVLDKYSNTAFQTYFNSMNSIDANNLKKEINNKLDKFGDRKGYFQTYYENLSYQLELEEIDSFIKKLNIKT